MFANHIRELRRARGIDATELAFRSGCSVRMLYEYERGESEPGLERARRIAENLASTVDDVFPQAPAVAS